MTNFDPQDVLARLDALEAGLDISQLPMRAIQNSLETNWQPDSSTLLQPASIGSDLLASSSLNAFLKLVTQGDHSIQFAGGSVIGTTGAVNAGGSVGQGFTCTRTGVGSYTITWTSAFAQQPFLVLQAVDNAAAGKTAQVLTQSSTGFTMATYNAAGTATADTSFNLLAVLLT